MAEKALQRVAKEMECPVCLEVPKTIPIFQCQQGHIHCKDCHPKLASCPLCRAKISEARSSIAEKIVSSLAGFHPTIKCIKIGCKEALHSQNFEDHIVKRHPELVRRAIVCRGYFDLTAMKLKDGSYEWAETSFSRVVISDDNQSAFLVTTEFRSDVLSVFASSLRGSQEDCEEYTCDINIYDGRVHLEKPFKEIILSRHQNFVDNFAIKDTEKVPVLYLPKNQLKRICDICQNKGSTEFTIDVIVKRKVFEKKKRSTLEKWSTAFSKALR